MVVDTVDVDTPDVVWLGDGNGPSREPDGYVAVAVGDDGQGMGYIPYWRDGG